MEELILLYYLNLYKYFLFIFFFILIFIYYIYSINYKKIIIQDTNIDIKKGSNIRIISNEIFKDYSNLDYFIYHISLNFLNYFNKVHYGKFFLKKNYTFKDIYLTIIKPSNVNIKITIVEGWQKYQLNDYLDNFFLENNDIEYNDVLANTYFIKSANNFKNLLDYMKNEKNIFEKNYLKSDLLNNFTFKQLMIIASLVEKEAKNNYDKRLISSVIFNRLKKGMKLQIDASVIYSLTEGLKKFDRKLTLNDLKYKHPYNTYYIKGLPPDLISYVGIKTIEIVLENYKSNFLFYFFDTNEDQHIYSTNYKNHRLKLNEYRKTK